MAYLLIGFLSLLWQVLALTEVLALSAHNELSLGLALGAWLALVGAGSLLAMRLGSGALLGLCFALSSVSGAALLYVLRIGRPLLGLAPGEVLSPFLTVGLCLLAFAPLCLSLGALFPLARRWGQRTAGYVYGLESLGAFLAGGLYSFLLAERLSPQALGALAASGGLAAGFFLLKGRLRPLVLLPSAATALLLWGAWGSASLEIPGFAFKARAPSRFGPLTALERKGQASIYQAGQLLFAYPDRETEELRAHLALLMHPEPRRVLIVEGSVGLLREALKHGPQEVLLLQVDPALSAFMERFLTEQDRAVLRDPRVRLLNADARALLRQAPGRYDVVLINLPSASTAGLNRFYTVQFFRLLKEQALAPRGVLALFLSPSPGYLSPPMALSYASVLKSLKEVFPHVLLSSPDYGAMFASGAPLAAGFPALGKRFHERGLATRHFHLHVLEDAFFPQRVLALKAQLEAADAPLNSDLRPVAYLYNLRLWAELQGSGPLKALLDVQEGQVALAGILLLALSLLWTRRRKRQAIYYSVLTTGYAGIVLSVVCLLGFQAARGYVWSQVGILTGLFMLGLAGGALGLRGLRLRVLEALMIALALLVGVFLRGMGFYALGALSGLLTGGLFASASEMVAQEEAGRLYGLELLGSFAGALVVSTLLVPLWGLKEAALSVAAAKALSLAMLRR
jgi:spermidine synthase